MLLSVVVPMSAQENTIIRVSTWASKIEFPEVELILVDDEKFIDSDSHRKLMRELEFCKNNLKITHIITAFNGPGAGRNIGKELASGEWVVFWDSDDFPNLEATLNVIEQNKEFEVDAIVSQYRNISAKTNLEIYRSNDRTINELVFNPGLWRIIFANSDKFKRLKFIETYMGEDQAFILNCLFANFKLSFNDTVIYNYFTNQEFQLTRNRKKIADIKKTIEHIMQDRVTSDCSLNELKYIIIMKLNISRIKYGSLYQRLDGAFTIVKILRKVGLKSFFLILTKR